MSLEALMIGDRFVETTPGGNVKHMRVVGVDVEPQYRHGADGRFVQLQREETGQRFNMLESDVVAAQWPDRWSVG